MTVATGGEDSRPVHAAPAHGHRSQHLECFSGLRGGCRCGPEGHSDALIRSFAARNFIGLPHDPQQRAPQQNEEERWKCM